MRRDPALTVERVLVVDGDAGFRCALGQMLADRFGFAVMSASNAEEAVSILDRAGGAFDVVISGVTPLAAVVAARWPELPVIVVHGSRQFASLLPVDIDESRLVPSLSKPFSSDELRTALREIG
jgi:DNA-binding NtrC family response regulator